MIRTLEIQNYRGFPRFQMDGLGRINLLVGRNNSGKTSILEALNLLASGGDAFALWSIVSRRGERVFLDLPTPRNVELEFEVSHLFHGHELRDGTKFSIAAKNSGSPKALNCFIAEISDRDTERRTETEGASPKSNSYMLVLSPSHKHKGEAAIPLTRRGNLRYDSIDTARRGRRGNIAETSSAQFISTESLNYDQLAFMWNEIVLTDAEKRVVSALRFIEEGVEGIAPLVMSPYYSSARGGFIVRLHGKEPMPIGSLGDGMWRILALAIAISKAKDGLLLVDEIDTGLHHSVMAQMWKLIDETAKALNVQVFATTHSYDCVHSLASICDPQSDDGEITIQRIETGRKSSVRYSEADIRQAAVNHIEVR